MGSSAWSNDSITTLIVPTGATTGARVVIDGAVGAIRVYDATNVLIAEISPSAGVAYYGADGSQVTMTSSGGAATLALQPPPVAGHVVGDAELQAFVSAGEPALNMFSPSLDGSNQSLITMTADTGSGPGIFLDATGGTIGFNASSVVVQDTAGTLGSVDLVPALGHWTDISTTALISAGGGGFVKGSSTYLARWQRIGKVGIYQFHITINTGGGFNPGVGVWLFALPFTLQASIVGCGPVFILDSATAFYAAVSAPAGSQTTIQVYRDGTGGALGAAGPGTAWATGDEIAGTYIGEIA